RSCRPRLTWFSESVPDDVPANTGTLSRSLRKTVSSENSGTRCAPEIVSRITIIYAAKPARKPPVAQVNGDTVRPSNGQRCCRFIARGNPPVTSINRETFHVQAYCTFDRRRLWRAGPDRRCRCACERAGQNDEKRIVRREDRDGRRRGDVPLEEHHPERRQFQGSH